MSGALPRVFYGDPAEALSRLERNSVYRKVRCCGCLHHDMRRKDDPCIKRLSPGKNACKGFDER